MKHEPSIKRIILGALAAIAAIILLTYTAAKIDVWYTSQQGYPREAQMTELIEGGYRDEKVRTDDREQS